MSHRSTRLGYLSHYKNGSNNSLVGVGNTVPTSGSNSETYSRKYNYTNAPTNIKSTSPHNLLATIQESEKRDLESDQEQTSPCLGKRGTGNTQKLNSLNSSRNQKYRGEKQNGLNDVSPNAGESPGGYNLTISESISPIQQNMEVASLGSISLLEKNKRCYHHSSVGVCNPCRPAHFATPV